MTESNIDPDKALIALGKFFYLALIKLISAIAGKYGKYQLRIWIVANLPPVYMALQMLSMAFVNGKPDYYCSGNEVNRESINFEWGIIFLFQNNSTFSSNWTLKTNDTCFFTPSNRTFDSTKLPCGTEGTKFVYNDNFGSTIVTEVVTVFIQLELAHISIFL